MMPTTRYLLAILIVLAPLPLFAKRLAPAPVPPVLHEGIRYEVPPGAYRDDRSQNGGYLEAFDAQTNELLRVIKVYEIEYDEAIERDIQDVFITGLSVEDTQLVVVDELGRKYVIDLKTFEVKRAVDSRDPATKK